MNAPAALPIGELARRSGFSPDTLRYYERLGLVPAPARTAAGRRAYEVRAIDRLRFVARAKELGCSLDEIHVLLRGFDDACGDVRSGLRALVEARIGDARRRAAELRAFTAQLEEARQALASEAAAGPCSPGCACLGQLGDGGQGGEGAARAAAPARAEPGARVAPHPAAAPGAGRPIACTLGADEMDGRMADWQAVLAGVTERAGLDAGVRLSSAPGSDLAEVSRLAQAEWACCSFFRFAITVDDRGAALEVRAPEDAQAILGSVFGGAE